MPQLNGSVKWWFNNSKGYGFIGHDGGADVFCHYSSIQVDGYKSLQEGDAVLFDIVEGVKGPQTGKVMTAPLPVREEWVPNRVYSPEIEQGIDALSQSDPDKVQFLRKREIC